MKVLNRVEISGFSTFQTQSYRTEAEGFVAHARRLNQYQLREIEPYLTIAFKGDFYGLLRKLQVPPSMWYATLRLNNLSNPMDYLGQENSILLFNSDFMTLLKAKSEVAIS